MLAALALDNFAADYSTPSSGAANVPAVASDAPAVNSAPAVATVATVQPVSTPVVHSFGETTDQTPKGGGSGDGMTGAAAKGAWDAAVGLMTDGSGGKGGGLVGSRVVAVILGLLCIAGGIFMFKPVREVVVETAKTGAKVAAAA